MTTSTKATKSRARPAIDPRIKERRIEVTRRQGRRRLRILLVLLGVILVVGAAAGATRSPLLDVDRVLISGAANTSATDITRAASLDRDRLMVDVHADDMASAIERLPWVDTAHVERRWPSTVRVTLRERIAVASVPAKGGGWVVADRHGRVLERSADPASHLPRIEGALPAGDPGSLVARPVLDAVAVAAAMPAELRPRAPVIAIAPDGLQLRLVPTGVAKLGDRRQLTAKLDAVMTVLERANTERLAVLDVRVPGAPVLTRA